MPGSAAPSAFAPAEEAIQASIAEPLGLSTIEAAALIKRLIDEKMASAIRKEVTLRGYRPSEFVVFAIGGAGPTTTVFAARARQLAAEQPGGEMARTTL